MRGIRSFLCEDEAATAVEYAVMLALILMAAIGAVTSVGENASTMWNSIDTELDAAGVGS